MNFSLGGDFDILVLPWGREFDIANTCFGQNAVPRGGNLTFSRYPGMGNLTLALVKMSNFPGSAGPPQPWGLTLIGALHEVCYDLFLTFGDFVTHYSEFWV